MPPAVAAIPAVIGAGASASGGKKHNKQADQQFRLQQQMAQFGQGLANTGMSQAWTPAAGYWSALLSGDPTKMSEAVGPTADILRSQGAAQSRELAARMPMGGEAVAAQGANALQNSNNIARLYAGVQPAAASALGQLSAIPIGAGSSFAGIGRPDLAGAFAVNQQQDNAKGGLGTGIGTLFGRQKQGKNNSRTGSSSSSSGGPGLGALTNPITNPGGV